MHWDWSQQNIVADEDELRERVNSLLPWINYELWSSIEKEKESKRRNRDERKIEYLELLRNQGIDITKFKMNDITFAEDEEDDEASGEGSFEVIE